MLSESSAISRDSDAARRMALRALCQPRYDGPQPKGVNRFGWAMTGIGAGASAVLLVLVVLSFRGLLLNRPLAGENLFASAVGLAYALFFARVWHGFRTRPDWRVALDVPLRVKVFAAAGAALSASLAGGAGALLLFAICAKTTFLRLMGRLGAAEVGKVEVILASLVAGLVCLPLWYVFEAMTELREWSRSALMVLLAAAAVWWAALGVSGAVWRSVAPVGFAVLCGGMFTISVGWLWWLVAATGGEDCLRHFRANEW